MSMALPIAVSADIVTASPYCTFMYHEISSSVPYHEKIQYHKQELRECDRLQKMYDDYLINRTKFDRAFLNDIKDRRSEFYFSPKEALKYGVISKII
jgi:ATP-dependent Clp protease protease subunit